ncbi:hypothetical protein ACQEU6_31780 [Spirillospora sp. CA-108201]
MPHTVAGDQELAEGIAPGSFSAPMAARSETRVPAEPQIRLRTSSCRLVIQENGTPQRGAEQHCPHRTGEVVFVAYATVSILGAVINGAASGLVLYFIGAIIAHLRVGSRDIVGGIVFLATAAAALTPGLLY